MHAEANLNNRFLCSEPEHRQPLIPPPDRPGKPDKPDAERDEGAEGKSLPCL